MLKSFWVFASPVGEGLSKAVIIRGYSPRLKHWMIALVNESNITTVKSDPCQAKFLDKGLNLRLTPISTTAWPLKRNFAPLLPDKSGKLNKMFPIFIKVSPMVFNLFYCTTVPSLVCNGQVSVH
jgi:hypothetical protein